MERETKTVQALKAHLNESVEIETAEIGPVKRIELLPAVDVTMAHDLVPHLKRAMVEAQTPASVGAVLYIPFPNSHAGTTYEIHTVADGPGIVDESTEVIAAVMPNERGVGRRQWTDFVVSVDEVESETQYDFLSAMPDAIEKVIEARK